MDGQKLKDYLIQIAGKITPETELEDIYKQLALLSDIDKSEEEEASGETLTQGEVEEKSKEWLK